MSIENFGNLQEVKISDSECVALVELNSANLPNCTGKESISFTRSLFGMYRKADFHDPDIFSTALCTVFSFYPAALCRQVVDPVKGLPSRLTFPPSIAEVKQALDAAVKLRKDIVCRANFILKRRTLDIETSIKSAVFGRYQTDGNSDYWRRKAAALVQLANPDLLTEEAALTEVDERIAKMCAEIDGEREKRRIEREAKSDRQQTGTSPGPVDIAAFRVQREPDDRERTRSEQAELDRLEEEEQAAALERARRSDAEKEPHFMAHMQKMRAQMTDEERREFEAQKAATVEKWSKEFGLDGGGDAA